MNLALVIVAMLGAEPVDSVPVFSWETASPVVWLEDRRQPAGPNAKPPKPFEWKGFFKIRSSGQLPVNGVFQVGDWPVQPEVEWLSRGIRYRKNAPPVVVGPNSGGQFNLLIREPGRYTFKASVGKAWSSQVTIEAKTFPFELGMRRPDFLEKYGNPDVIIPGGPQRYERWIYKGWTSLVVYCDRKAGMQAETMQAEEWMARLMEAVAGDVKATEVASKTFDVPANGQSIVLHARDATIIGTRMFYLDRIDCACTWDDPREYIEWRTSLPAGAYDARLKYASPSAGGGYQFAVNAFRGNAPQPIATATFVVRPTDRWEDFAESSVGRLVLREEGTYTIRIQAVRRVQSGPPRGLLNVRSLALDRS